MNFPAFLLTSPIQAEKAGHISSDLSSHQIGIWPDVDFTKPVEALSDAAPTDQLPVEQPGNALSGDGPVWSFFNDYYHRIHLLPALIDLGNLIAERAFEIEVWNAHLTSQNLAAIDALDASGLDLSAPVDPPTLYDALESRMHTLTASTNGPAIVVASFTFDFPSEDPMLTVVGDRVVVWPFRPNWKYQVVERMAWLTDVLAAYDGTEQRRELRSTPRRSFNYQFLATNDDRDHLDALLWQWQARLFVLPVFTDPGQLTGAASIDDITLNVATTHLGYRSGGYAVLKSSNRRTEAVRIIGLSADSLTLESGLRADWPAGAQIFPAELARLADTQPLTAHSSEVDELAVQFDMELTGNVSAVDSGTNYRGYPVLEEQPNWREKITAEYQRLLDRLDNQTGVIGIYDRLSRPIHVQDYLWTRSGRAAIAALRAWLHARRGRLNPIWVPSFRADITLADSVVASEAVIKIRWIGYTRYLQQQIGRRDIVIRLRDGSRIYKRIDAASELNDDTEQLVLNSNMGQDIAPDDVVMISFLQLSRLESDVVEFAWHSAGVVECRHLFRGLADDL